jgi:hypothetical protein
MIIGLANMQDADMRSICKERIESLEHWLRRPIDEVLTAAYGNYFSHEDANSGRVLKKKILETIQERRTKEPGRYPRTIDALLLDNAIDIVCNPQLFSGHFRDALAAAFPEGYAEARTFLSRIAAPRNNLAHANAISLRQAEQIICYTNDVIESLKIYYKPKGMENDYNVPLILRITDSFGKVFTRSQCYASPEGSILMNCHDKQGDLYPGDTLTVEVEVDPAYTEDYELRWTVAAEPITETGPKVAVHIANKHVGLQLGIACTVVTKSDWHRMPGEKDDMMILVYKVLPPK